MNLYCINRECISMIVTECFSITTFYSLFLWHLLSSARTFFILHQVFTIFLSTTIIFSIKVVVQKGGIMFQVKIKLTNVTKYNSSLL